MSPIEISVRLADSLSNAQYTDKWVCFVDILGYSSKLKNSHTPSDFALPISIMLSFRLLVKDTPEISAMRFSDCFYVVADEKDFGKLLEFIKGLYSQLLDISKQKIDASKGERKECIMPCLLRGGITKGEIYPKSVKLILKIS